MGNKYGGNELSIMHIVWEKIKYVTQVWYFYHNHNYVSIISVNKTIFMGAFYGCLIVDITLKVCGAGLALIRLSNKNWTKRNKNKLNKL